MGFLIIKNADSKKSISNLFLNIIIILLAIVVAFLSYSLVTKFKSSSGKKPAAIESNTLPASIIQLEVLNGCGVSGAADKITDYLRKNHVDVVQTGNYMSFEIDKTLVLDRTGNKANAEKIADILGIDRKNIVQQLNQDYFLDVSLVIGKDYNQLINNLK
jgi:hypothetical protein